ncbi:hypothetical protein K7432_002841 [Basidiobolus ranarum]|uniref:Uncharacterized protein n=1 Tax=Basidiobolus ranarum TaxID=34480 RepID=A0ABR2W7J5_9FUNG
MARHTRSGSLTSQGLTAFSLHPGTITTNLWRHVDFSEIADEDAMLDYQGQNIITEFFLKHYPTEAKTLSQGSATTLAAAFDPTIKDKSGLFLNNANVDIEGVKPYALDDEEAKKLWELSELLIVNKL